MNPPIIEALSDSFPHISKNGVLPLSSPRTINNFSFAKNNELQSNLLTNTNCLVNQEPKILLDSRQTYKKEMNSPSRAYESDLKKNSQKTIFKDTAKGILIRKTGNLRLPIASLEASPISSIRNSDYPSPFQFEKETVIASAIAKKSERFFPKVDENEINETKSSNNLTSMIGLRSPRKVTFSNDTADKEDKMDSLGLRNYKSTPFSNATNPNRGLTINLNEKSPKLNRREQDNLHRGPRLISEALLSGAPDHMLFKEGKPLTCETLTNNHIDFINEDEEFMPKQEEIENYKKLRIPPLLSREGSLRLPLIASARGSKGTIFDLSPQIKTERADFEKLSKKENMAENNENYAESPPFKGHLRKTASFTVGRNKTKRIYKFPEN